MDNSTKICCALALIAIVLSLYSIFTREKYTAALDDDKDVYSDGTNDSGVITVDSNGNLSVNSLAKVNTLDAAVDAVKDMNVDTSVGSSSTNSSLPTSKAVVNYVDGVVSTSETNAYNYTDDYFTVQSTNILDFTMNDLLDGSGTTYTGPRGASYDSSTARWTSGTDFTIPVDKSIISVVNISNTESGGNSYGLKDAKFCVIHMTLDRTSTINIPVVTFYDYETSTDFSDVAAEYRDQRLLTRVAYYPNSKRLVLYITATCDSCGSSGSLLTVRGALTGTVRMVIRWLPIES